MSMKSQPRPTGVSIGIGSGIGGGLGLVFALLIGRGLAARARLWSGDRGSDRAPCRVRQRVTFFGLTAGTRHWLRKDAA